MKMESLDTNVCPQTSPVSQEDRPRSKTFVYAFYSLLFLYFLYLESACRQLFEVSSYHLVSAWLVTEGRNYILLIFWMLITLVWVALSADHVRNAFIALTGRQIPCVFLGDRFRSGQYIIRGGERGEKPVFVPWFTFENLNPNKTIDMVYRRKYFLKDKENNLSPSDLLLPGRVILLGGFQLTALFFSVACSLYVLTDYDYQLGDRPFERDLADFSPSYIVSFYALVGIVYIGGSSLIIINSKSSAQDNQRVWNIPSTLKEGGRAVGRIIAREKFHATTTSKSTKQQRYFVGFSVQFDSLAGCSPSIFVNFELQAVNENNISIARGAYRRELIALKKINDQIISYAEKAIETGEYVSFRIGRGLVIEPDLTTA